MWEVIIASLEEPFCKYIGFLISILSSNNVGSPLLEILTYVGLSLLIAYSTAFFVCIGSLGEIIVKFGIVFANVISSTE
jgi:hypothetical protein